MFYIIRKKKSLDFKKYSKGSEAENRHKIRICLATVDTSLDGLNG
jgi:hypothetical protein